jgi:hypothetical protein
MHHDPSDPKVVLFMSHLLNTFLRQLTNAPKIMHPRTNTVRTHRTALTEPPR